MRQNRSRINSKTDKKYINSLQNDLMEKISGLSLNSQFNRPSTALNNQSHTKKLFSSYDEEFEIINLNKQQKPLGILQKAKLITNSRKQQIQRAKKSLKTSNKQAQGMFLTGCGIYNLQSQQPEELCDNFQSVDMNDALKYLVSHQKDDLQQLRKMIKKTNTQLHEYSQDIYKTQNEVVSAADLFGKQLTIDLQLKINKCSSGNNYDTDRLKRKISTSHSKRIKTGTKIIDF